MLVRKFRVKGGLGRTVDLFLFWGGGVMEMEGVS